MTTLQVIELFWAECYCQEHGFTFRHISRPFTTPVIDTEQFAF